MRYGRLNGSMRTVPYTFGRYVASISWQIFDNYTQTIVHPKDDGTITIKMDGGLEITRKYEWFILIAFKPINLPLNKALHFKYKLDPKYDVMDITKYIWFLDLPLESDHYPGYFTIPGYSRYLINENGDILSSYGNGDMIAPVKCIRNDDYKNVYMVDDYGKGSNETIHRLVAGTFLIPPANAPELVVNHIDLDTHNNKSDNLEWVSHNVNLAHAQLMYDNNVKAFIINITKDKQTKTFTSLKQAAQYINDTTVNVWKAFSGKKSITNVDVDILNSDGTQIKGFKKLAKVIELKNIHTGEILTFMTMGKCAIFLDTNKSNIHQAIHQHFLIHGKFIARYADKPWPNITLDDIKTRRSSGPKEVLLYNTETKTEQQRFNSGKALVKYLVSLGLGSKKIIMSSLKNGSQRKVGKFIFKYSDDSNPWKYQ